MIFKEKIVQMLQNWIKKKVKSQRAHSVPNRRNGSDLRPHHHMKLLSTEHERRLSRPLNGPRG